MSLWVKIRLWLSPVFLRTQVLTRIREFFSNLLNVRPRDKKDYYPLFRWLVSKRLAFAIVVALGVASALYISVMVPIRRPGGGETPTYKYRSLPLKFYSGTVNILARDGHLAYTGEVAKGAAAGHGILYGADGETVVYEGEFSGSMYNGTGTLYYRNGSPRYEGGFADNRYNGTGSSYRSNGVIEYSGDYVAGVRTGAGTLFNSVGSKVFEGSFLNDDIVYQEFLDRPTADIAAMYSGKTVTYQDGQEYCVAMPEINAVYAEKDGSDTLDNEWTVERVYVLSGSVPLRSGRCTTLPELTEAMGEPLYFGTAWVDLAEAVAWDLLAQNADSGLDTVRIDKSASLENVFDVADYDRNFQVYLYTFQQDGVLYTFYFKDVGETEFLMYAMESA